MVKRQRGLCESLEVNYVFRGHESCSPQSKLVFSSRVDHFVLDLVTIGEVQVAKVKRRVGASPPVG